MSAQPKVDVLAVLDAVERAAKTNTVRMLGTEEGVAAMAQLVELREARAAVAELIEADRALDDCNWFDADACDSDELAEAKRMKLAALARIGGAA